MHFLGGGVRTSIEAVAADLEKYIQHQDQYGYSKWAIIHKDTEEFMGRAGLIHVPDTGEMDLGYAIHKKFWNQGYSTEIAAGLFQEALKHTSKDKIIGIVNSENKHSARVLEKIGFSYRGKGHYFGMDVDIYKPD